ncbi:probable xyloglucan galactosyltransferase GT11 [Beta vulgaris subsp. vulgaris]|uniref:probable xyloglucan galactosyltransferase GT11 n=1 Tax=Beta vulgaris subsp. vulgaris TaxID=3555 RepID=UPI00053FBA55|nr:probable xyloglucan galactosyltransferase GT11 [Beta vulgaris subsp. vulgaris]
MPKVFRGCQKSLCFVAAAALGFLLLHFSLPEFAYISTYAKTIWQSQGMYLGLSLASSVPEDPCTGRYIYMHDLPTRLNQDLLTKCQTLRKKFNFCPYVENEGFGSRLNLNDSSENSESVMSGKSWYETNQFSSAMMFHTRMKQYECLTTNSSLASAIYAPYYPGLEAGRYMFGRFNLSAKDAGALDFTSWLRGRPEWLRLYGWDHFFVAGRITWDFRRPSYLGTNWGSKLMNLPETKNMTMLTIESSPYANNDFAIPYPTFFHPSNDNEVLQWQERVKRTKRTHLFAFAGAPRPHITSSVRGELISQCKKASGKRCNLVNCAPKNKISCNSPDHILKAFMMSDFCLQPTGDSYTRRSTFDAILMGCIPVFVHPGSAYTQYFWHLPKNYTSYSVYIPRQGIKNGTVSVEKVLLRIPQNAVTAMREVVIGMIPSIIYARNKLKTTEDAFDIAIKGILERIEDARRNIIEGKDPRSRFPEKSTWKYYLTGKVDKHEWDSFF